MHLPKQAILNLMAAGVLTKHTVEYRVKDGRLEHLHATKGWRSRTLSSLRALGVL